MRSKNTGKGISVVLIERATGSGCLVGKALHGTYNYRSEFGP